MVFVLTIECEDLRESLLRKPYFGYFFRLNERQCVQVKAKSQKMAENLNCKITWENSQVLWPLLGGNP